jgi:arylsulfatase A-like enzyme/lysophospholipase L1-like esterase
MPPNVLLIQCDDLGPDDLGLHGPHTPHLLKLREESFSANDFSVQPVCSPSRAALLTGRHPLRVGVSHVHGGKDFLHLDETTLAERFRDAGYATGMWGKWHLGHSEGYFPWQRGFQEAYMADLYRHRQTRGRYNGVRSSSEQWADEHIVELAGDFIQRHTDQPWFAYVPTLTPHTPHDAPEHWVHFHKDRGCPPGLAVNRAMISFLDEQIGRLLTRLEETGQMENTVVLFLSDHGPAIAANELNETDRKLRNRSGRRGWKGDLYENGLQSPLFIRWPAAIAPCACTDPLQLLDLPPTLLALCGIPCERMEGRSFAPTLLERIPARTGDIFTYAHLGWLTSGPPYSMTGIPGEYKPGPPGPFEEQSLAIRRGMFKLILNPEYASRRELLLYDLENDPAELHDVAAEFPARREELFATLRTWWTEILREPHAFQPPVLKILPGEQFFAANMPCAVTGGAVNCVNGIIGWETPGACATYNMEVSHAGTATIECVQTQAVPAPDEWELSLSSGAPPLRVATGKAVEMDLCGGEVSLTLKALRVDAASRLAGIKINSRPQTLLLIGSSIMEQWGQPDALAPELRVVNRAIGGTITSDWIDRIGPLLREIEPDFVLCYVGSNDVGNRRNPDDILRDLLRVREQIPCPFGYISIIKCPQRDGRHGEIADVCSAIRSALPPEDLWIDSDPVFLPQGNPVPHYYVEDQLHLTPAAYAALLAHAQPQVRAWTTAAG